MTPPLPNPRWYHVAAAAVAGIALLVLAALPDASGPGERVFHDLVQTVGGILVAVAVGGGFIQSLQRREWRRRTYEQTYSLLKHAMFQTALVAERALFVLGKPELVSELDVLFRLPYGEAQDAQRLDQKSAAMAKLLAVLEGRDPEIAQRTREAARDLDARAERLRALGLELGPYLADDPIGLGNKIAALHRRVRDLVVDELLAREPDAQKLGLVAYRVFDASCEVATALGAEHAEFRKHPIPDDPVLRKEIDDDERLAAEDDAARTELRDLWRDFERGSAELEKGIRETTEDARRLQARVQRPPEDDPPAGSPT